MGAQTGTTGAENNPLVSHLCVSEGSALMCRVRVRDGFQCCLLLNLTGCKIVVLVTF